MEIAGRKMSPALIVGAGMFATAFIGFAGITPHLTGGGDNAGYIAEAEAWLALGHRANLYEAGTPYDGLKPPLFPFLLAIVEWIFGRNVAAMKAMLVLFASGSVWAAWWSLRACLAINAKPDEADKNALTAALIAFWFSLCPTLTLYTHDVLSDVPFTFFALLAIGLSARVVLLQKLFLNGVLLLLVLTVATMLRSAGIIVAGACFSFLALEAVTRRRDVVWFAIAKVSAAVAVLTLGLLLYQQLGSNSYLSLIGRPLEQAQDSVLHSGELQPIAAPRFSDDSFVSHIVRRGTYYACFLPAEIAGYDGLGPKEAIIVLAVLAALVAFAGALRLWREGRRAIPVCWTLYLGALLLVPWLESRYYLPMLPLYLCLFWCGAEWIIRSIAPRSTFLLVLFTLPLLVLPAVSLFGTFFMAGHEQIEGATYVEWLAGVFVAAVLAFVAVRSESALLRQSGMTYCIAAMLLILGLSRCIAENILRERNRVPVRSAPGWPELYEASLWLKNNARPDDHVISGRASLVWFWSGLRGIIISDAKNAQTQKKLAAAQWAILDGIGEDLWSERVLKPLLVAQKDKWSVAWTGKNTVVLKRRTGN